MRDFVEGFGKVKQDCVNLGLVVRSSHPVVDCLDESHKTVLTGIHVVGEE